MHLKKQNDKKHKKHKKRKEYKITYSNYDEIHGWRDVLCVCVIFLLVLVVYGIMFYLISIKK